MHVNYTVQRGAQVSSKLLLALASAVVLGFETHDPVGSKTVYVFGNGASSSTRGVVGLSEHAPHLFHRNVAWVFTHSHRVRVRALALYGHDAHFVTLLQRTVLMQDYTSKDAVVGRSVKLLLILASTVIPDFSSRRDLWPKYLLWLKYVSEKQREAENIVEE
jgi:hypothetical protein